MIEPSMDLRATFFLKPSQALSLDGAGKTDPAVSQDKRFDVLLTQLSQIQGSLPAQGAGAPSPALKAALASVSQSLSGLGTAQARQLAVSPGVKQSLVSSLVTQFGLQPSDGRQLSQWLDTALQKADSQGGLPTQGNLPKKSPPDGSENLAALSVGAAALATPGTGPGPQGGTTGNNKTQPVSSAQPASQDVQVQLASLVQRPLEIKLVSTRTQVLDDGSSPANSPQLGQALPQAPKAKEQGTPTVQAPAGLSASSIPKAPQVEPKILAQAAAPKAPQVDQEVPKAVPLAVPQQPVSSGVSESPEPQSQQVNAIGTNSGTQVVNANQQPKPALEIVSTGGEAAPKAAKVNEAGTSGSRSPKPVQAPASPRPEPQVAAQAVSAAPVAQGQAPSGLQASGGDLVSLAQVLSGPLASAMDVTVVPEKAQPAAPQALQVVFNGNQDAGLDLSAAPVANPQNQVGKSQAQVVPAAPPPQPETAAVQAVPVPSAPVLPSASQAKPEIAPAVRNASANTPQPAQAEDSATSVKDLKLSKELKGQLKGLDQEQPFIPAAQSGVKQDASGLLKDASVRESVIKQIASELDGLGKDATALRIQLKPESLGKIDVTLTSEGGKVAARIFAGSLEVKDVITNHLNAFRQTLENKGIPVQELSVTVRADIGQGQGQNHPAPSDFSWNFSRQEAQNAPRVPGFPRDWQLGDASFSSQRFSALA